MDTSDILKPLAATVLYGVSSILITTINKAVLTTYGFPSFNFLGLGQIVTTIIVLGLGRWFNWVDFPTPSKDQFIKVFPLPVFYVLTLVLGLGSTQKLNLPMFTVLRRFTLLFTSLGQMVILNQYESLPVNGTLMFMILGALVAAVNDLTFDVLGYLFVFLNNATTAASSLYNKKKLNSQMTKYEIMFYNAVIVLLPTIAWTALLGDFPKVMAFDQWTNPWFIISFGLSCMLGFVLIYSMILVTQLTSPLTLTVTGCIKNIVVTYGGMIVYQDYVYDPYNFAGINISVVASLVYSYLKYRESTDKQSPKDSDSPSPHDSDSSEQTQQTV